VDEVRNIENYLTNSSVIYKSDIWEVMILWPCGYDGEQEIKKGILRGNIMGNSMCEGRRD
jgi:hypothetical protein